MSTRAAQRVLSSPYDYYKTMWNWRFRNERRTYSRDRANSEMKFHLMHILTWTSHRIMRLSKFLFSTFYHIWFRFLSDLYLTYTFFTFTCIFCKDRGKALVNHASNVKCTFPIICNSIRTTLAGSIRHSLDLATLSVWRSCLSILLDCLRRFTAQRYLSDSPFFA